MDTSEQRVGVAKSYGKFGVYRARGCNVYPIAYLQELRRSHAVEAAKSIAAQEGIRYVGVA